MGALALAAPPCLSLGAVVLMCAPVGRALPLTVPRSTQITYAQTVRDGYGGVVAYGSAVTPAELAPFGPRNPARVVCRGSDCAALATVDGFQYPVTSTDHGRDWRNAGHWFAGAWADGPAFAQRIEVLGPGVLVAWPQFEGVYLTTTAGRTWFTVATPGTPIAASAARGAVTVTVRASGRRTTRFTSLDGGRTWRLPR